MGEFKEIIISNGMISLISVEDYDRVNQYNWAANKIKHIYYAHRRRHKDEDFDTKTVQLHRFILGLLGTKDQHIHVDHINGNGLDNRRENLRRTDISHNLANMHARRSKHKFKGVSFASRKRHNQWRARIRKDGVLIDLGHYPTIELAAAAYDGAAKALFGEFANGNFFA